MLMRHPPRTALQLAALLSLSLLLAPSARPDWAMLRHDPARSGHADGPAPTLDAVEWSVDLGGAVDSSPAVARGLVVVGTVDGVLHSRDATTGAAKWSAVVGRALVSSPCLTESRAFVGCVDGWLYAFDLTTGKEAWRARTSRSVVASPLVVGDRVICGSTDGRLYAFGCADGTCLWKTEAGGEVQAGAAAVNDTVVYADWDQRVRCVRVADGSPVWPEPYVAEGPVVACPVVAGQYVVVACLSPTSLSPTAVLNLHCLDVATGKRIWGNAGANPWVAERERGPMSVATCPTVVGEAVWFLTGEGYANWSAQVRSCALATGARLAAVPQNALGQGWAFGDSSPALAGSSLYFADYAGLLHQFDTATGRAVRALPLGAKTRSSPAISDGRLYLGLTDGKLLCVR